MTDIDTPDVRATTLVPGAHRVVRVLDTDEGPFEGALVTSGDGVAVRVDVSTFGGWVGWRYSGAEHVAAPIDVIRRRGGHDVLLPWCTDRILGFLIRRSATGAVLTPGECSTLVVSLLRGLDEIGGGAEGGRTGTWWVTDGGRPVFVFGPGTDARAGAEEIVRRLAADSTDKVLKRALSTVEKGLEKASAQPRVPPRLLDAWEHELLAVAAPQPLDRGSHAPERAREVARATASHESVLPRNGQRLRADRRPPSRSFMTAAVAVAHAGKESFRLSFARISAGVHARRGRRAGEARGTGASSHSRARPFIVGAAAAGVVLAAGLLWPSGGEPGEAADAGGRRPAEAASVAAGEVPSATPMSEDAGAREEPEGTEEKAAADETRAAEDPNRTSPSVGEDPVAAAGDLLTMITGCRARGDSACPAAVAPGSEGVVKELEAAAEGSTVELVDEYGDVAVVRLDIGTEGGSEDAGPQPPAHRMVVLIRAAEKWLVRDVYDVADQP
ncbi:MAG: hypothetical protein K0R99_4286 [Microbacterium sp.]|jgi:hypothetical protein|uniref:hypothetical protein n=1 Tax=Microbacterium sp. TaxID=51671 RepID=UPI00260A1D99|nr:hypothetical protein [Microbacterium sp.]MDF2562840.1 hypothetical protein [Microbacterium sp.]